MCELYDTANVSVTMPITKKISIRSLLSEWHAPLFWQYVDNLKLLLLQMFHSLVEWWEKMKHIVLYLRKSSRPTISALALHSPSHLHRVLNEFRLFLLLLLIIWFIHFVSFFFFFWFSCIQTCERFELVMSWSRRNLFSNSQLYVSVFFLSKLNYF